MTPTPTTWGEVRTDLGGGEYGPITGYMIPAQEAEGLMVARETKQRLNRRCQELEHEVRVLTNSCPYRRVLTALEPHLVESHDQDCGAIGTEVAPGEWEGGGDCTCGSLAAIDEARRLIGTSTNESEG